MDIAEFFEKQKWIFAKTYAEKAPHEYCLKEQVVGSPEEFIEACRYILEEGFEANWWGRYPNKYIYINGHMYWVMHPIAHEAILINRCIASDYIYNIYPKKKENKDVSDLQGN